VRGLPFFSSPWLWNTWLSCLLRRRRVVTDVDLVFGVFSLFAESGRRRVVPDVDHRIPAVHRSRHPPPVPPLRSTADDRLHPRNGGTLTTLTNTETDTLREQILLISWTTTTRSRRRRRRGAEKREGKLCPRVLPVPRRRRRRRRRCLPRVRVRVRVKVRVKGLLGV
jgi:hypothetical protein